MNAVPSGAKATATGWESPPRELTHKMDQVEKTFVPRVLPIVKGEKVVFTNGDPLLHNVFSHSRAKEFDLGKNRKGESQWLRFEKTGVVDVYCDIHESMSASILVLPNKAFARTRPDGGFRIEGIPPGAYTVYAWLHGSEPAVEKVTFTAGEKKALTFQLVEAGQAGNHVDKHGRPYKQRQTY